ncbi:lipid A deacylase LpxR family protein [Pelagibius litoralis]|uniref:Lipid A deacylase LpxR family protein n=1 Tax=Pelagibius litoralis TaxID=374515 RepID=A0A967F0R6_9PROT|nr:lipid A deacylase LpxR family protein [Pelagibius litoralis]NIA70866.1 lipid A deacylase LpxR family protein [Pelagibius litoralis]
MIIARRVAGLSTKRFRRLVFVGLLALAVPLSAAAQDQDPESTQEKEPPPGPDESWIISLQFSNDMFGGSDRHFTHGTRFSALSPDGFVPDFIESAAKALPLFPQDGNLRVSYSLGQDIFTPERIEDRDLIDDDRPYAGWLYGGIGLVSENGSRLDQLELNIGIVGPASLAEQVQTEWHRLLDITTPEGWDNQLENEPGIVLYYERKWRNLWETRITDLEVLDELAFDVTPHLGGALGNVYTYGAGGLTLRIGEDLPNDYGPPKLRPNLPGSDYFRPDDAIGWYLFAGVEGRVVLQNIFLDGNTFEDSHSVDKRPLVGDLQAGLAITLGERVRLAYTHLWRTEEFHEQDAPDQFGTLSMSVRF